LEKCITRKISILKKEGIFFDDYEIIEVQQHEFVSSLSNILNNFKVDGLKNHYMSYNLKNRTIDKIYCIHCGELIKD
jgi:hypothetical protein